MRDFDANATSRVHPAALAAFEAAWRAYPDPCMPAARAAVAGARASIAAALGASPKEVIFTAGGTSADRLAFALVRRLTPQTVPEVLVSAVEHGAVRDYAAALGARGELAVTTCPVLPTGTLDLAAAARLLLARPALASVLLAHNETGVLQPLPALVALARRAGTWVHTDAVQAVGRVPLHFGALGVDMLSMAGHKVGAVGGVGVLLVAESSGLDPSEGPLACCPELHLAAAAEDNVAGILALAAALQNAPSVAARRRVASLRDGLEAQLLARLGAKGVRVLGEGAARLGNTSALLLPGAEAEAVLMALDVRGYAISAGAACASGALEPSPSLLAMGLTAEEARQVIRISLAADVQDNDVAALLQALVAVLDRL